MAVSADIDDCSPEVMLAYYRRLYPFKAIFNWLNHSHTPTKLFTHREFAFTLAGDVYLRYNSFSNAEDLKKQVCALNPTRFEIGPMYSARPKDKRTVRPSAFTPLQRELVFDIDMTDYDSIRTCCSGGSICKRCWAFIAVSVEVLDAAIRDQFGYTQLLWVYSGRRGIHLWVSDKEALELTDEQRKAVVGSLTVVTGGQEMHKKVNVRLGTKALPPSLKSAVDILKLRFGDIILQDQDCFADKAGWEELLHLIPDSALAEELKEDWADAQLSSEEKWEELMNRVRKFDKGTPKRIALMAAMEDIVLQYTYPRLDAEVSKHRNHLLKAPFCIHPKTSRVCVPVDPAKIHEFNPEKVPTVGQLLRELDEAAKTRQGGDNAMDTDENTHEENGGVHRNDWEKTSLKPYVDMLDKFAAGLMNEARLAKREAGGDMDW